jgi:hypothetical protein
MIVKVFGKQIFRGEVQNPNGYTRRQTWTHPIAASATALKALTATSASVATTITPTAQPDFARVISVTPGGTTADVAAGSYVITGTNIRGEALTQTLTFSANDTLKQVTTKAFKTVTSVVAPIQDGAGATFSIGVEEVLGLDRGMSEAAVVDGYVDGVRETTAATVTFSTTDISLNTVDFNTGLANTKVFTVLFVPTETTQKVGTTA